MRWSNEEGLIAHFGGSFNDASPGQVLVVSSISAAGLKVDKNYRFSLGWDQDPSLTFVARPANEDYSIYVAEGKTAEFALPIHFNLGAEGQKEALRIGGPGRVILNAANVLPGGIEVYEEGNLTIRHSQAFGNPTGDWVLSLNGAETSAEVEFVVAAHLQNKGIRFNQGMLENKGWLYDLGFLENTSPTFSAHVLNTGTLQNDDVLEVRGGPFDFENRGTVDAHLSFTQGDYAHRVTLNGGSILTKGLTLLKAEGVGVQAHEVILKGTGNHRLSDLIQTGFDVNASLMIQGGDWTLDRANSDRGRINALIEMGSLYVTQRYAGTVTAQAGTVLGGTGGFRGDVTIMAGATFNPGELSSPSGAFTAGGLTLSGGSVTSFRIGEESHTSVDVTTFLRIASGSLIDLEFDTAIEEGSYLIFTYGTKQGNFLPRIRTATAGYNVAFDLSTNNQISIVIDSTNLLFWNGGTTQADGTVHGGSGTWNPVATNWTDRNGNLTNSWSDGRVAVFGGAAGTVTIEGTQSVNGLHFTSSYTLQPSVVAPYGALLLALPETEIVAAPDMIGTINVPLVGAAGLRINGAGSVNLSRDNTFTGGTLVTSGILVIASNTALGNPTDGIGLTATGSSAGVSVVGTVSALPETLVIEKEARLYVGGTIAVEGEGKYGVVSQNQGMVYNNGVIKSEDSHAVVLDDRSFVVNNDGSAINGGDESAGVYGTGSDVQVHNQGGVISGGQDAIFIEGDGMVLNRENSYIHSGYGATNAAGIRFISSAQSSSIANYDTGEITGDAFGIYLTGGGQISNHGKIEALGFADPGTKVGVYLGDGYSTLYHNGEIIGDVVAEGHNSLFLRAGSSIQGDLIGTEDVTLHLQNLTGDEAVSTVTYSDLVSGETRLEGNLRIEYSPIEWILDRDLAQLSSASLSHGQFVLQSTGPEGLTFGGDVELSQSATLSGKGHFTGSLFVSADSTLAITDSTVEQLNLADLATVKFTVQENGPAVAEVGHLVLGSTIRLEINAVRPILEGSYLLFTYETLGGSADPMALFSGAPVGYNVSFDLSIDNEVNLRLDSGGLAFWNGSHLAPDGIVHGGDGEWSLDSSATNWTNYNATDSAPWENGMTAVFIGQAGEVTLDSSLQVLGMQFGTDGYRIAAKTGAEEIELLGTATEFRIDIDVTTDLAIALAGEGGLYKTGEGTLILNEASHYEGATLVALGTLRQGVAGAIPTGTDLEFYHGVLELNDFDLEVSSLSGDGGMVDLGAATLHVQQQTTTSFAGEIIGTGDLVKSGTGELHLSGPLSHTGQTVVNEGLLATGNLPGSTLILNGGQYSPGGSTAQTVTLGGLILNGGEFIFQIGLAASDHLVVADGAAQLLGKTHFVFEGEPGLTGGVIPLIDGLASGWDLSQITFSGSISSGASFLLSADGTQLLVSLYNGEPIISPILQNSQPVGTPVTAHFIVDGPVRTGTPEESNTVDRLTFLPDSSLQVHHELTVTSGSFAVSGGVATLSGGRVIAPDDFAKLGVGALDLRTDVAVSGKAEIVQGGLIVNGTFAAGEGLAVGQAGFLGGSGVIAADVVNHGRINPGNSPGILTILGDFTQPAGGLLEIEILSPKLHDELHVGGIARLGGTVAFFGSGLKLGEKITFLHAASVEGRFDHILLPSTLRGRIDLTSSTGSLLIAPKSYTQLAATPNQQQVAGALDSFIRAKGGDREVISLALDGLRTGKEYQQAFQAIAPTYFESLGQIRAEQGFSQMQQINQRLSAVARQPFRALGVEAVLAYDRNGEPVFTPAPDHRWGLWVEGNGLFAKITSVGQLPSYRFDSGGFTTGVDYQWSEQFSTGVYAGYQYTRSGSAVGGKTRIDSAIFGGYASYAAGGFYANALIGGAADQYDLRRPIQFASIERTGRSRTDGTQVNTGLNLGYDWQIGQFTLGPIASIQYSKTDIDSLTETGADSLNLRLGGQEVHSLRTVLGARVTASWQLSESVSISPEVRLSWQREHLNDSRTLRATLDGGDAASFDYTTTSPSSRDRFFLGAGISSRLGERWDASVYYNATFGEGETLVNMVSGGVSWKF